MAKLLPKGQITIPKDVRESLRASAGDMIVFHKSDGVWTIERQPGSLVEFMRWVGQHARPMSPKELEEIDASGRYAEQLDEQRYGID